VLDYILLLHLITGSKYNGDGLFKNCKKLHWKGTKQKNRTPQKVNTKGNSS
jgi:hypothetical protein